MEMDETSALIAWGRQVLVNRRLRKHRERLEEEKRGLITPPRLMSCANDDPADTSGVSADLMSPEASTFAAHEASRQNCEVEQPRGADCRSGGSPRGPDICLSGVRSLVGAADVMHLRRRVEAARRCVQELKELEKHNEEVFQRRKQELQGMLEQSRCLKCGDPSVAEISNSTHVGRDAVLGSAMATSPPPLPPLKQSKQRQQQERQWGRKEQLEELLRLRKALAIGRRNEELSGTAVATLTACAREMQDWDNRLWRFLRESVQDWRLQLMPSLYRFHEFVKSLPVLSLPLLPQLKERQEIDKMSAECLSPERSQGHDSAANILTSSNSDEVMLLLENLCPSIEQVEKLSVQEAICVVINALAQAASKTVIFLPSLLDLLDKKNIQLMDLLEEAEKQLQQQEDTMNQAHSLLGKLQDDKEALETEGAALDDAVEQLQQRVGLLRLQHEQSQRQEGELEDKLQESQLCLHELRQEIEKATSLRSDAVKRTDEHKRLAESAAQQRARLEAEVQCATTRRKRLEAEVQQLRRAATAAKEEENEVNRQRRRQDDELHVARLALDASKEALLERQKRHAEEQAELASLRCREHELQSDITAVEEACEKLIAEVEVQRAVESAVRQEFASIHSEMTELRKREAEARRLLHCTNTKLELARTALLYGRGRAASASNGHVPSLSSSPLPASPNLAEILRQSSKKDGSEKEDGPRGDTTAAAVARPCSAAMEVMLTARGVQREEEKPRVAYLHRVQERQQQEQNHGDSSHSALNYRTGSSTLVSYDDSNGQTPLIVLRPSCRGE